MSKCVNECVRLAPSWRMLNRYVARYYKSLRQRTSSSVGLALKKKKHSTRVKLQRAANLMACVAARLCNFHIPHQPTSELDCIGLSSCAFCYTLYRSKQGRNAAGDGSPAIFGQPGTEYLIAPHKVCHSCYPNVTTLRSGLCCRNSVCLSVCLSSVCLSSVCNVGAPYSGG